MSEPRKCPSEARDFKSHRVYRCEEREGLSHTGVVCHQGRMWWPNGRPNINPNYRSRKAVRLAQAVAA